MAADVYLHDQSMPGGPAAPSDVILRETGPALLGNAILLTGGIPSSGNLVKIARLLMASSVLPTGENRKSLGRLITGSVLTAAVLTRLVVLNLLASIASSSNLVRRILLSKEGFISSSGSLFRGIGVLTAGSIVPTGQLLRLPNLVKTSTILGSGQLSRSTAIHRYGVLGPTGEMRKLFGLFFTSLISSQSTLIKRVSVRFLSSLASSSTKSIFVTKVLYGVQPAVAQLYRKPILAFSGVLVPEGLYVGALQFAISLAAEIVGTGELVRRARTFYVGSIASSATFSRRLNKVKTLLGGLTTAGSLLKGAQRLTGGNAGTSGGVSLTGRYSRFMQSAIVTSGTFSKIYVYMRLLPATIGLQGNLASLIAQRYMLFSGVIGLTGQVAKSGQQFMSGNLQTIGFLERAIQKQFLAEIDIDRNFIRSFFKVISGHISPSSTIQRLSIKTLAGSIHVTGLYYKLLYVYLSGTLSTVSTFSLRAGKIREIIQSVTSWVVNHIVAVFQHDATVESITMKLELESLGREPDVQLNGKNLLAQASSVVVQPMLTGLTQTVEVLNRIIYTEAATIDMLIEVESLGVGVASDNLDQAQVLTQVI